MKLYLVTVYYVRVEANSYVVWASDRLLAIEQALGGRPLTPVDRIIVEELSS